MSGQHDNNNNNKLSRMRLDAHNYRPLSLELVSSFDCNVNEGSARETGGRLVRIAEATTTVSSIRKKKDRVSRAAC